MPCRRSHSKSRNGCKQCKKRKVKCNEEHPKCKPCTKRGIWCSFQESSLDDRPSASSTPLRSPDFPDDIEIPPDISLTVRTLELKLFHHFSTVTGTTLVHKDDGPRGLYHFQVLTPNLALQHQFLLETLMALTALHLAHLDPTTRDSWIRIAMTYHDRALVGFNEALANITPSNCEAATLSSIFVLIITIAVMGMSRRNDTLELDAVSEVVGLRKLLQGVEIILVQSENTIQNGDFREWLQPMLDSHHHKIAVQDSGVSIAQKYWESHPEDSHPDSRLYHSLLESLNSLLALIFDQSGEHKETYQASCQYLQEAMRTFPSHHYFGSVLTWTLRIHPTFVELLEEKDTVACLIFVHWGVALHLIRDEWFARDAGAQIVRALLPSLDAALGENQEMIDPAMDDGQREFARVIEWARQAVETS
ncbi:uncharacterized protein PAC_17050 [Phialocephala subalpina]|uniref:Zn(2)-C6 fungal-type domain-containing protein n=1 Tax=Phialocephala subalpina TaxID=576137 RepID=A0A1L7XQ26_9HELO|nr:uncharacterized protein PAC_17050 [Phialocephala subalpina]